MCRPRTLVGSKRIGIDIVILPHFRANEKEQWQIPATASFYVFCGGPPPKIGYQYIKSDLNQLGSKVVQGHSTRFRTHANYQGT